MHFLWEGKLFYKAFLAFFPCIFLVAGGLKCLIFAGSPLWVYCIQIVSLPSRSWRSPMCQLHEECRTLFCKTNYYSHICSHPNLMSCSLINHLMIIFFILFSFYWKFGNSKLCIHLSADSKWSDSRRRTWCCSWSSCSPCREHKRWELEWLGYKTSW